MDSHIYSDPDPGRQNFAVPTDPDLMHWNKLVTIYKIKENVQIISSKTPP